MKADDYRTLDKLMKNTPDGYVLDALRAIEGDLRRSIEQDLPLLSGLDNDRRDLIGEISTLTLTRDALTKEVATLRELKTSLDWSVNSIEARLGEAISETRSGFNALFAAVAKINDCKK